MLVNQVKNSDKNVNNLDNLEIQEILLKQRMLQAMMPSYFFGMTEDLSPLLNKLSLHHSATNLYRLRKWQFVDRKPK